MATTRTTTETHPRSRPWRSATSGLTALTAVSLITITTSIATARAADEAPGVAGTWTWSWKDPAGLTHRHVLEVEGLGTKLAARERFDDLEPVPVQDLRLVGKTLSFHVIRGARRADYKGAVTADDTIRGTVTVTSQGQSNEDLWEARRKVASRAEAK